MLRWLHSPRPPRRFSMQRLGRRLLNVLLLLTILWAYAPLQAAAEPAGAQPQQAQAQQSTPQTLNFVNGVAQVQSTTSLNQPQVYLFFGTQGQTLRIQLSSQPGGANFELKGANNSVYKSFGDPTLDWPFTLPESQNYRITINSNIPVVFTLVVTLGGSAPPQRITFAPGQTTAQVTGTAAAGQSPQYVFNAAAGQNVRIILISAASAANFTVSGVTDGMIYKPGTDASRDWTRDLAVTQDYLITVFSPVPVTFTLQIILQSLQPAPPERLTFLPGQSVITPSGSLQANIPKAYVVNIAAGQQIRILLTSTPAGSANFSFSGVSDSFTYKPFTDASREWTFTTPTAQDYLITVLSNVPATYVLELTVPTPLPPTAPPLTPLPTVPVGCTADTIQNGGFETDGFWLFGDDPVPATYSSTTVHSGLRSVRLGIDPVLGAGVQNQKSFSSILQPFQISPGATIAQLRWWNFYRTEEGVTDNPGLAEDKQQVVLLNPDLSTVAVLRSVRRNTNGWQEELVDLTPYVGKSLLLYFNAYNDGNGQRTWQFLDDVMINVCYPAVTATPLFPTPLPTAFPTMPPPMMPTASLPIVVMPTIGPAPLPAPLVFASPVAATPISGALSSLGDQSTNGEPEIFVLPPQQESVQQEQPAQQALPPLVLIQPTLTPTPLPTAGPALTTLRIFNRPAGEVLTWTAIMLGALAIIGILVAFIWQASGRSRSQP